MRTNQVYETLFESVYRNHVIRIWFKGEDSPELEPTANNLISEAVSNGSSPQEIARVIAGNDGVAAVQVNRAGSKVAALVYNDWP